MIKRYDIFEESFGYTGCRIDITENNHDGDCGGEWVRYDNIKHLIPDNRLTEEGFKELFKTELADLNIYLIAGFIKTAEKQGWIKPEGET